MKYDDDFYRGKLTSIENELSNLFKEILKDLGGKIVYHDSEVLEESPYELDDDKNWITVEVTDGHSGVVKEVIVVEISESDNVIHGGGEIYAVEKDDLSYGKWYNFYDLTSVIDRMNLLSEMKVD